MLLYMSHSIRGQCKYIPVAAKNYAEYQEDKKQGIMNTMHLIAPNFKKLMDSYNISVQFSDHDTCVKHVIRPFVRDKLCPAETPENRKIITKHIGTLIKGLEKKNKAEEEKIALSLEGYLTRLVSTKYGTFTGGRKRRRRTRRKRRRKKTKKRRRKRKKRGATKKRKHPEGSQDEPRPTRRRLRIREVLNRMDDIEGRRRAALRRNEFERGQPMRREIHRRNFNNRWINIMDRHRNVNRNRWNAASNLTIEEVEILIHDIIKLRNEMQEFIRKYDFDTPLYGDPNFPRGRDRDNLTFIRNGIEDMNDRILSLERQIRMMEIAEAD